MVHLKRVTGEWSVCESDRHGRSADLQAGAEAQQGGPLPDAACCTHAPGSAASCAAHVDPGPLYPAPASKPKPCMGA